MRKRLLVPLWAGLLLILSAAVLAMSPAAPAAAPATLDDAARALRQGPVYVDPAAADQLSPSQEKALEKKIEDADKPVFVAVLPQSSAYPPDDLLQNLRTDTGITGVYAVRLGDGFDAGADPQVMPVRAVANLTTAVKAPGTDTDAAAQLDAFVDRAVEQARGSAPASWSGGTNDGGARGAAPVAGLIVLGGVAVVGGAAAYTVVRRNRKRQEEEERTSLDKLRIVVDEDITSYGETLDRLDFHPAEAGADDAMRADYERALDSYEDAKSRMAAARRPSDVRGVTQALEDGRYSLAVLDARRNHRELPARRPPCFFDPRHRPVGRRRGVEAVRRHRPGGPRLRCGRGPAPRGRGPDEPYGRRGRRLPTPVLGGRTGVRTLGRRLLRRRTAARPAGRHDARLDALDPRLRGRVRRR
ncbi:hypothetical protein SAMN04883147_1112221 [Streptomyces sp. DpondAA-F4]|nr:hypothetical protein SAMN04883147_1112221 [Streptomyces sp. DpondAA-F4]